jgi:hypothetical protein
MCAPAVKSNRMFGGRMYCALTIRIPFTFHPLYTVVSIHIILRKQYVGF